MSFYVANVLALCSGISFTFTMTVLCLYYSNKLRPRKFIGDVLLINLFFALGLLYLKILMKDFVERSMIADDENWKDLWSASKKMIRRY